MKQLFAVLVCLLSLTPVLAAEGEPVLSFSAVETRARAGDAEAQLEVGILYEFGFNMKNNKVPALAWYILAAKQGNPQAEQRSTLLKKSLTDEQVTEAERLSKTLISATTGSATQPKIETPGAMATDKKTDTPKTETPGAKSDSPKTEAKTDSE